MKKTILSSLGALAIALVAVPTSNATILDLGTNGEGFINGALFSVSSQHPAGTGVFDPFLTVQNSPWEQGYNSGTGNFDTKREPQWNHEIKLSDMNATTINGVQYFGLIVDVNEPNGGPKAGISLNGLKIFTSSTLQNSTSTDANGFFNGSLGTLRYDLGTDNSVLYNDQHSGSGTADITIWIPVSDFAGASQDDYVYVYQRWGNTDASEGGFEETALAGGVPVPEMSTLFPIIGLLAAIFATQFVRRRQLAGLSK